MTTAVATLTDFLLARIAEDEAEGARAETGPPRSYEQDGDPIVEYQISWTIQPRLLVEARVKRELLALHSQYDLDESGEPHGREDCTTLRLLALPYASHPDYRDEWRPIGGMI